MSLLGISNSPPIALKPPPSLLACSPRLLSLSHLSIRKKKLLVTRVRNLDSKCETLPTVLSMEPGKESVELNTNLYANIEPYDTGFLKVSDLHSIYYEQSGNPTGHPVVFLHGGPGGGTAPSNRRFFDPEFYRIILFDQRGAGKSTPHACLEENSTWDLINDTEKLREHLNILEWQVFGGSWGSTLALAYSQSHPEKVTGLVLRGIFLLRKKEIDWFYEGGASTIFPDAWESFRDLIPENERGCFIDAYKRRLNSDDMETQYAAARAWTKWEMMTAHLLPDEENIKRGDDDDFLLGRYDMGCPMMSAWDLHKAWPEADFKVVPDARHSANEPGIASELVAANEKLKNIIKNGLRTEVHQTLSPIAHISLLWFGICWKAGCIIYRILNLKARICVMSCPCTVNVLDRILIIFLFAG